MTFHSICRRDLPASQSPFRVVDEREHEVEWVNRFLDAQSTHGLAPLSLRQYAPAFSALVERPAGRGARVRLLPLPPETIPILQCWLRTERPLTHALVASAPALCGELNRRQGPGLEWVLFRAGDRRGDEDQAGGRVSQVPGGALT